MNAKFFGIKYKQEKQEYLSFICPMQYVIDNSEVLIYGKDKKYGYQRSPKKSHYLKISRRLQTDHGLVTPNSIVLGLNKEQLEEKFVVKLIEDNEYESVISLSPKSSDDVKFRIIDGQHRIEGFKDAISNVSDEHAADDLKNYSANIIVMLLDSNHRMPEVDVFSDINSKAKPLKMDLTVLARYQYTLLEQPSDVHSKEFFLTCLINKVNEGESCFGWINGITIDVNCEKKIGLVGFKAFMESLDKFYKFFVDENTLKNMNSFDEKADYLEKCAITAYAEFAKCWDLVFEKWNVSEKRWITDPFGEDIVVYYKENYYIQKTMGVVAINGLIEDAYCEGDGFLRFKNILDASELTTNDWLTSGRFSGLSSQAGASRIKKAILCEDE